MAQYIPKDALAAKIEKVIDEPAPLHDQQCSWEDGYYCGLYKADSIIDALEVKEVDLIKEVANWKIDHQVYGMDETFYDFAKHFFELGLQAQKGE